MQASDLLPPPLREVVGELLRELLRGVADGQLADLLGCGAQELLRRQANKCCCYCLLLLFISLC